MLRCMDSVIRALHVAESVTTLHVGVSSNETNWDVSCWKAVLRRLSPLSLTPEFNVFE